MSKIPVAVLTRLSLFTALGVTLGFSLMSIPNVELVTATVFIAGVVSGIRGGAFVGAATEGLFSFLNPLGAPSPPLWFAQVAAMAVTGAAGGLFFKSRNPMNALMRARIGAAGFLCTLNFALLTTLAYALTVSFSFRQILASLIFGIWFYVVHLFSNTAVFLTIVPAVLKILPAAHAPAEPLIQGKQQ
jgi:hypothetical protein